MRRETAGGLLLGLSVVAAVVLGAAGVSYGLPVVFAVGAFIAGCLLLANSF